MSANIHSQNKRLLDTFRLSLYEGDLSATANALKSLFAESAKIHLAFPFEDLNGPQELLEKVYKPLQNSIPDLERRDTILIGGTALTGSNWVGCCGYYTGSFLRSWLDIPPTGHQVSMRFHEFFRIEDNQVIEMQALWDIPEVMMQADAWPMSPSLGREWHVPGPATQDGLLDNSQDVQLAKSSCDLVSKMLEALGNYASGGVLGMRLQDYWHPHCSWYGPSGIGTCRGITGFRNWHQIPFLNAMPDRVGSVGKGNLFGDGNYVGFTAWPGMNMSVTGDGFLGIAPSGQKITMRSLDFWRCEDGLIRENWVLVDILDVYNQIGVDVFARIKEFNKAKSVSTNGIKYTEDFK